MEPEVNQIAPFKRDPSLSSDTPVEQDIPIQSFQPPCEIESPAPPTPVERVFEKVHEFMKPEEEEEDDELLIVEDIVREKEQEQQQEEIVDENLLESPIIFDDEPSLKFEEGSRQGTMRPDEEPLVFEDEVLVHEPSPEAPAQEPQVCPPQLTDIKEIISENESSEPGPERLDVEEITPPIIEPEVVAPVELEMAPEVEELKVKEVVKDETESDPESWDNQEDDPLSSYLSPQGIISDEEKKESSKSVSRFGKRMSIDEDTMFPKTEVKESNNSYSDEAKNMDDEMVLIDQPR